MDEHIGSVLVETYRIDRLVGEGGMGKVYEASHLRLPKRFAVKMLNVSMLGNLEALLRFRREAEIVATLDHPNIVNLFDYNLTDEGVPYVVLEFLDGEHLGRRIARGRLSLAETMRIFVPVAQGLFCAHQKEIVHRDLKPENILLLKNEQVKVVDFGIAKIRGGAELTGINTILGTVPYMAPEQLLGGGIDARTDQFALGSIVYEMLTGEMVFGANSVPAAAAKVAHHMPPPIAGVPDEVNRALLRALAKKPDDRFPSVDGFMKAFLEAASRRGSAIPQVAVALSELVMEELPPLPGEATAITARPTAPAPEPTVAPSLFTEPPMRRDAAPEAGARPGVVTERTPRPEPAPPRIRREEAGGDQMTSRLARDEPTVQGEAPGPGLAYQEPTRQGPSEVASRPPPQWDDATAQYSPEATLPPVVAPRSEVSSEHTALTNSPMSRDGDDPARTRPGLDEPASGQAMMWIVLAAAAVAGLLVGLWLFLR